MTFLLHALVVPALAADFDADVFDLEEVALDEAGDLVDGLDAELGDLDDARVMFAVGRPSPGTAGLQNTWTVTGATPGANVSVFGGGAGATPVPQCPGQSASVANPVLVGSAVADRTGTALVSVVIPARYAGVTATFQAFEAANCRLSMTSSVTLR